MDVSPLLPGSKRLLLSQLYPLPHTRVKPGFGRHAMAAERMARKMRAGDRGETPWQAMPASRHERVRSPGERVGGPCYSRFHISSRSGRMPIVWMFSASNAMAMLPSE